MAIAGSENQAKKSATGIKLKMYDNAVTVSLVCNFKEKLRKLQNNFNFFQHIEILCYRVKLSYGPYIESIASIIYFLNILNLPVVVKTGSR